MNDIVGVRFKGAGKIYHFSTAGIKIKNGDNVVVETVRGAEYGTVVTDVFQKSDDELVQPLKDVLRIATKEDKKKYLENIEKKEVAMQLCREKIARHDLDMKLLDAEYILDGTKITFFFVSEDRVDFRELVKDLAAEFKIRIELRQIGARDGAKMVGGLGCCGRETCCTSWMSDFKQVSIKMAKKQNISLNPAKISGCCGRIMCCLEHENDTYNYMSKGLPSVGDLVETRDGTIKVTDINILAGIIKGRLVTEENIDGKSREVLSPELRTYDKDGIKSARKNTKCGGCKKNHPQKNSKKS